jgi:hypothetical protein
MKYISFYLKKLSCIPEFGSRSRKIHLRHQSEENIENRLSTLSDELITTETPSKAWYIAKHICKKRTTPFNLLHSSNGVIGEQWSYAAEISFRLVGRHKFMLLPTLELSKKGTTLYLHISHAWHIWGMSVWNRRYISFITLPTSLTKYCIWK